MIPVLCQRAVLPSASFQPTSVSIDSPFFGQVVPFSTSVNVQWHVDQGSAQGDVYVDGGFMASGNGSANVSFAAGTNTLEVRVANGTVSSGNYTIFGLASIIAVYVIDGSDVQVQFDSPMTFNGGNFGTPDSSFTVAGNPPIAITGSSGNSVTAQFPYGSLNTGGGDPWVMNADPNSGIPNWVETSCPVNSGSGSTQNS